MSDFSVVNLVDDRLVNKSIQIPLIRGAQSIAKQTISCVGGNPNTTNINYVLSISTPNIAVDRRFTSCQS